MYFNQSLSPSLEGVPEGGVRNWLDSNSNVRSPLCSHHSTLYCTMDAKKRAEMKTLMLSRQEELLAEIEVLKELTKPIAPENAIGRVSRMDAINNKSINACRY